MTATKTTTAGTVATWLCRPVGRSGVPPPPTALVGGVLVEDGDGCGGAGLPPLTVAGGAADADNGGHNHVVLLWPRLIAELATVAAEAAAATARPPSWLRRPVSIVIE